MNRGVILKRMVLASLWLGGVAGASGRDIPVFREYSLPIAFYNDQGELLGSGPAPDVHARRALRDTQAQENLLGQETLLDIAFPGSATLQRRTASKLGSPAPDGMEQTETRPRTRSDNANRNWLADSLSLPSLGRASSNAAASVMGVAEEESSWGWLAKDVNARGEERQTQADDHDPLEDLNMAADPMAPSEHLQEEHDLRRGTSPDDSDFTAGDKAEDGAGKKTGDIDSGRKPTAPAAGEAGKNMLAEAGLTRFPAGSAAGELSQTRSILAEISSQVRPTLSSMLLASPEGRPSFPGSGSRSGSSQPNLMESIARPDVPFSPGFSSNRMTTASGFLGGHTRAGSWQGGWKSQTANENLSSYLTTHYESTPVRKPAPATRGNIKPTVNSGALKPGWY